MKRLKAVLVVLFALTMSLFLFACGGDETKYKVSVEYDSAQGSVTLDPQKDEYAQDEKIVITVTANSGYTLKSFKVNDADAALSNGKYNLTVKGDTTIKAEFEQDLSGYDYVITRIASVTGVKDLTDSAEQADLQAMLDGLTINVATEGDNVALKVSDCDVEGLDAVKLHTVGDYTLTLTPKDCNPSGRSTEVTFSIGHDWEVDASNPNIKTCRHDKAQLETLEEDTVIHYGTFHEGTDATLPADVWEEDKVYTNNKTESNISEFGTVKTASGNVKVPTVTAGHLEKGMTITIRGTAKTTTGDKSPWGHANENWNSPSIGIADRDLNVSNPEHPGYTGGTSVIVREEGWVLYDGIGTPRMLASIMGGAFTSSNGWRNYGSHPNEPTTTTPQTNVSGYEHGTIPTDWSSVQNWWVYSDGATMPSGTSYANDIPIEYSWTYREDGVIEMVYRYNYTAAKPSELKIYVKVPDSAAGYYDTILHGDYCDIKITESEIVTLRTPVEGGFTYKGLVSGAKTDYAENDEFDAATIDATMKYVQAPTVDETLRISNAQVYAYTGSEDYNAVKGNNDILNSLDNWVSMANSNLSAKYKVFKIHFTRGGKTFIALMNKSDGSLPFTITENKVESAEGGDVTVNDVLFENNSKVGAFGLSLNADKKIVLTPEGAVYAQALSDSQKAAFTDLGSASKYIALHIYGATLDTVATFSETFTVKAGNADVPKLVSIEDGDVYLVLAVSQADNVVISGLQSTDIILDLSNMSGLNASSEVKTEGMKLNAANGELTVTYTVPANTAQKDIVVGLPAYNLTIPMDEWLEGNTEFTKPEELGSGFTVKHIKYEGTTLSVTLVVPAASLTAYEPIEVTLSLSGKLEITDYVHYDLDFVKTDDAAVLSDGYVVLAGDDNALTVAKAFKTDDLKNGVISGSVSLNINNGVFESFSTHGILTIEYAVENGEVVILNGAEGVTGTVSLIGTYANSRDTDYGAIVVLTVDVTELGIASGDYYFEQVGETFNATAAPESIYKIASGKLTVYTISGTTELVLTAEGTCLKEGLYAWAVKEGGNVVCYAGAAASGGEHVDQNGDNHCDLCGGTIESNKTVKSDANWFPAGHPSINIVEGDVVTFTGKYADNIAEGGYDSVLAVFIEEAEGSGWDSDGNDEHTNGTYHTTQDGFANWTNFNGWNSTRAPYAEDVPGFTVEDGGYERFSSSVITEEHPYNTGNGWTNAYGTILDETNFNEAKQGGTFRFIVTYLNGVITTTAQLWGPDMAAFHSTPFFEYYTTVKVDPTAGRYTVKIFGKQATTNHVSLVDDEIVVTKLHTTNSAIENVVSATVGTHTAPEAVEYAASTSGEFAVVKLTGVAAKETAGHYVSFTINFSQALVNTTSVKLVDKQGAAIANAVCTLAEDHQSVDVYLPIADGMKEAYLDFTNYEASTLQSDIKIDLNDLAVSDVTSAVAGVDALTIASGSFTVTYTGTVQNTDTLVVGTVSKKLSELVNATDLGNGYTARAEINGNTTTVTVTKYAADLTKAITDIEIRLERDGALLARDVIAAAVKVAGSSIGTEINGKGWYATANGAQLILFTNAYSDLTLNVNAGEKTEVANLADYDLSVANGAFKASNLLTKNGSVVVSKSGDTTLTVIVLDLASLGVEAATPYGYQADDAKYYTVNAERAIAEVTAETSGEKKQLIKSDCVTAGLEAYETEDKSFYYNLNALATGGHVWTKKDSASEDELHGYDVIYTCSNGCGAIKYEQTTTTQTWGGGTAGSYDGWGACTWETFGSVHKGGMYELTGTNRSNENNVWNLPEPGITDVADTNADGYRIDNGWHQNDNANFELTANVSASGSVDAVKEHLDGATVTFTFDYTDAKKLVIITKVVDGEYSYTLTVTLTGDLIDTYYLAMHQDESKFEASKVVTEVPKDKEVPAALTKHVHDWSQSDKCPTDGAIHPDHGISEDHPHIKGEDQVHCSICGATMEHEHSYNANYVCEYCGMVDVKTIDAFATTDKNVAAGSFGADGWWNGGSTTFESGEGDFIVKFTFGCGTCNGHTGVFEMQLVTIGDYGDGYFDFNPNDDNVWGGIVAAESTSHATYTVNKFGTKPAYANDVTYVVYGYRIGTNFVMCYQILKAGSVEWTATLIASDFPTGSLNLHINGYTNGMVDLHGYTGTITAKA